VNMTFFGKTENAESEMDSKFKFKTYLSLVSKFQEVQKKCRTFLLSLKLLEKFLISLSKKSYKTNNVSFRNKIGQTPFFLQFFVRNFFGHFLTTFSRI
jgi:hypothetical protein